MVDAAGTTKYSYTAGNQLWTESQPFASSTLTNTYVNRLRTAMSLQQPTGVWTNKFVYDAAARLTNVTSPAGAFAYTVGGASAASSLVKKIALPNSSYITNTYAAVARLTGTYLDNSAHSILDSAVYGYNTASQRTAFTNAAGTYVLYSYDNIGQLKVAASSVSTENRGYTYDAAWNLNYLTNDGALNTFTVDSQNQLTGDPNAPTDSYDANGNLQIREWSGLLLYAYTNDDENRLTWIENDDYGASPPLWLTQFAYDGLGRLRKRVEYTYNSGGSPVWSSETHYIYDGTRVIQERDTNNTPTVGYTRGTDLSGSLEGAGGIGGMLARSSGYSGGNWSTHYFYHADGNGNITYLVDSSQAMAATYRYDPFGNTLFLQRLPSLRKPLLPLQQGMPRQQRDVHNLMSSGKFLLVLLCSAGLFVTLFWLVGKWEGLEATIPLAAAALGTFSAYLWKAELRLAAIERKLGAGHAPSEAGNRS